MKEIELLLAKAISPADVRTDPTNPAYTVPHTWGVYKIIGTDCGPSGKRFRKGNHPVRHQELMREFREVRLIALFCEEALARQLATAMNNAS